MHDLDESEPSSTLRRFSGPHLRTMTRGCTIEVYFPLFPSSRASSLPLLVLPLSYQTYSTTIGKLCHFPVIGRSVGRVAVFFSSLSLFPPWLDFPTTPHF